MASLDVPCRPYKRFSSLSRNFLIGEGEEIDFLIEKNPNQFIFLEAKVSLVKVKDVAELHEVRKVFHKKFPKLIVCYQEGEHILNPQVPLTLC